MTSPTDRERNLVAALAEDPCYNTDHQLELAFGPKVGRVIAEMRRLVRDYDDTNRQTDAEVEALMEERYPGWTAAWKDLVDQLEIHNDLMASRQATSQPVEDESFVVAVGNAFDGTTIYGPFVDRETAGVWAEGIDRNVDWWVIDLNSPKRERSSDA